MERLRRKTTLVWIFCALCFALTCEGQTAIVPTTVVCPAPQLTVGTPTATLGSYSVLTFVCLSYDASVALTATTTPWTMTAAKTGPSPAINFADAEVPAPAGATCTLAHPPNPAGSLMLFENGLLQTAGVDYTLSGSTITFIAASVPNPGDALIAWYRY